MSTRDDLLAPQIPALAALTDMGLVKRAQKELEQGKVPAIDVDADGTVTATFDDGGVTRLIPGKGVRDAPCSCGASGGCRHRVGAVLAHQRHASGGGGPAAPPTTDTSTQTETSPTTKTSAPTPAWSPGDVDDASLVTLLGEGTLERAKKLRLAGYIAEVRPGRFVGDDLPVVHLQTSSVRFLARGDVGYARCDCTQTTGCLHVALAVWAFRVKDARDREAAVLTVEVNDGEASPKKAPLAIETSLDVMRLVVDQGVARLPPVATSRSALAKDALSRASLTRLMLAVEELELLIEQYRRRSALYRRERLRLVLVELLARARAGQGGGVLPARDILGADEALSTKLDQARLIGLGATVSEDGDDRRGEILFADPSGQGLLVHERTYRRADAVADEDGPALATRTAVGGSALAVLASGQKVSNAVTRQANRTINFSTGGLQKTSVTRGGFALDCLPEDRVIRSVATFMAARRQQAPGVLGPRLVADDVQVIVIDTVDAVVWDPAAQAVVVHARDAEGGTIIVERSHRAITPGGTQATALAFAEGALVKPGVVVGHVVLVSDTLVVQALAVYRDRLIVLDLEAPSKAPAKAQAALPIGARPAASTPLMVLVDDVTVLRDEVVVNGVRALSSSSLERGQRLVRRLRDAGLLWVDRLVEVADNGTFLLLVSDEGGGGLVGRLDCP
jgi:DNA-binding transcriptional ArsR family regulator